MSNEELEKFEATGRRMIPLEVGPRELETAPSPGLESAPVADDLTELMGPLKNLPGKWTGSSGQGWNFIALPFANPGDSNPPNRRLDYRLLMNQYNEELRFDFVDARVPNRGIRRSTPAEQTDQEVTALDYEQDVVQVDADDFPASGLPSVNGRGIHREPGLWLNMLNQVTEEVNIARLATIPHGDSVLALGRSRVEEGLASIPNINGMPTGVSCDPDHPYLSPYKHYIANPFHGKVPNPTPGFPGFSPQNPNQLLKDFNASLAGKVKETTILHVDTTIASGGISNIPFVVKQANATDMASTFWIYELLECHPNGEPKFIMQYSQTIFLDFFPTKDGTPGLIRWPHVSINTLHKLPS